MLEKGMELDHGTTKKGHFIINDFTAREKQWLDDAGIHYTVMINNVEAFYEQRALTLADEARGSRSSCANTSSETFDTPANFSTGSMGGFFTYQEFLDHLDAMATEYPNLITQRAVIDTFQTHENRPIYWLKISDNPYVNESEPEVLYTSIHHAREPQSLAQLIFYMWYVLENYGSDDEVTYLVDNTEMYFIPMINPDGYIENETNYPNGGGLWRKNKRDNLDGEYGVDLNRNYGYKWGYDNDGSSPETSSQTYRGLAPFSEPETKAVQWFCEQHEFQLALNYHSHGNYLIYPWGYIPSPLSPDSNYFISIAQQMTAQNNYVFGTGYETVNYATNGVSDDWMYGEEETKNKIYSMTPEVGNSGDGFWPSPTRIIPLSEENVRPNLLLSHFAGHYITMTDVSEPTLSSLEGTIDVEFERLGLQFDASNEYTLNPVSSNVLSPAQAISFSSMNVREPQIEAFDYTLDPNTAVGDEVVFELISSHGGYSMSQEITKIYGTPTVALVENGNDLDHFSTFDWDITSEDFVSPSDAITDSPLDNYSNNQVSELEYERIIDMRQSLSGYISFYAKWQIEAGWDYVQMQAAPVGTNDWGPLCGLYTKEGQPEQDEGQPVWDGNQLSWVQEQIDLNDYIGQRIKVKFRLISDQFVNYDGFYIDDFQFVTLVDAASEIPLDTGFVDSLQSVEKSSANSELTIYPNPSNNHVYVSQNGVTLDLIVLYDLQGREVFRKSVWAEKVLLNLNTVAPGLYIVECHSKSTTQRQQLLISR